jgi:hypothetical protein
MTARIEQAKSRIESDIRKLQEPYRGRLRDFIDKRAMRMAVENELKKRGGGYRYLAGCWAGEHGTPPQLTE